MKILMKQFLESQEAGLEKIVHILKQTQRELDLILTNPFVHITYTSYFCLFPFILKKQTVTNYKRTQRTYLTGIELLPVVV